MPMSAAFFRRLSGNFVGGFLHPLLHQVLANPDQPPIALHLGLESNDHRLCLQCRGTKPIERVNVDRSVP
ncbi:MAG: hypothetical protein WCQ77_02085 [Planctomycetota bacterium]